MPQRPRLLSVHLLGCLLLAATTSAESAPATATGTEPQIQDFQAATVPAGWKAGEGSELAVTAERFKSGNQSLRWSWRNAEATLVIQEAAAFDKRSANSAFGLWVYNEKPAATPLRADLLYGEKAVASLWFWMDYKGWRPLGAMYHEVGCEPGQPIDGIRFHAPQGVASGRLYLDGARFNLKLANGYPTPTYQMPWSGHPDGLLHQEAVVLSAADICLNRPWLPARKKAEAITRQERQEMATLAQRLLPELTRPAKGITPEVLAQLRRRMAEYRIERNGDKVTGRPIDSGSLVPPGDAVDLWEYLKLCTDVQKAYAQAQQPEQLLELKQRFVDLSAHWLDQGWAEGTRLGGWGNYPGPGLDSFLLMRDVLAEAGLAREMSLALADHLACQGSGQYLAEKPGSSMDGLGFWNNQLLPCLLLLPDEAERLQHLRAVQRFYSLALINPATIGRDGCPYHHGAFHYAYASYNLPRLFRVLAKMADTDFRISPESQNRLKTCVRAIAFTFNNGEQAYNIVARPGHPLGGNVSFLSTILAEMGTPDRTESLDRDMAALCLTQIDAKEKAKEPYQSWIAQGITPAELSGHLTLNGGPVAIHRRKDWSVSIGGISPFYRAVEIYGWTQTNNYGRYARNGTLCVVSNGTPPSLAASGWSKEGWDWFHFPGATNAVRAQQQDIFDGYAMYGGGRETTGGTSLDGNGIFGMEFNGGIDRNSFKRSVFCFDNRVTALTSDIQGTTEDPMVTTLFQNTLAPGAERLWLDGAKIDAFPFETRIDGARAHWLIDNKGTGYFIPAGHDPIRMACRKQEWRYLIAQYLIDKNNNPLNGTPAYHDFGPAQRKKIGEYAKCYRPSSGDYAVAWFEHGAKPANASCAYTMLIRTTPGEMEAFAAKAPQHILAQDARLHALFDAETHTTGYALFAANTAIAVDGLLKSNSVPCYVMLRCDGTTLNLSVACPDINRKTPIRLVLKGKWAAARKPVEPFSATPQGDDTQIEVQPESYLPMKSELKTGA